MALDATVGGASANSYITVADADAFAATDLGRNVKAWNDAHPEEKEAALIRATEEIDFAVGTVGSSYSSTQARLFPRSSDIDLSTNLPRIPVRLKKATYLQAAFLLRNANIIDDASSRRARGLSSFANPDGTSGTVSTDPYNGLDARVVPIVTELSSGSVIGTIITT